MAQVCKTCGLTPYRGSNPLPSTDFQGRRKNLVSELKAQAHALAGVIARQITLELVVGRGDDVGIS